MFCALHRLGRRNSSFQRLHVNASCCPEDAKFWVMIGKFAFEQMLVPHLGSVSGVLAACISFHCSAPFTPALHPKNQTENSSSNPHAAQAVPSLTAGQEERAFSGHSGVSRITWHGNPCPCWGWLGFGGCQRPSVGSGVLIPCPFDTVSFLAQTGPPIAPPESHRPRQPSALDVQGTRSSLNVWPTSSLQHGTEL